MTGESFIDVDFCQRAKTGQVVSGDVFVSRKIKEEGRIISVLSDGLGSGVKASVLANLTATMALRYTSAFVDVRKSAGTIMDTLPICEVRKISYSTFTIVDLDDDGRTRVIEHGNPAAGPAARASNRVPLERADITLENWKDRTICYSEFDVQLGDRIVCFSDGVSQSGLGRKGLPLGWGQENVVRFLSPAGGAGAGNLLAGAGAQDSWPRPWPMTVRVAKDDITCGVVYYRHPRRLAGHHRAAVLPRSAMANWPSWCCISTGARPSAAAPPPISCRVCSTAPVTMTAWPSWTRKSPRRRQWRAWT